MIGTAELVVIFCVVLILFGGKRLPELAKSIGLGLREFKKAFHEDTEFTPDFPSKKVDDLEVLKSDVDSKIEKL